MIERIERHARQATEALGRDRIDPRVLAVMGRLPREDFVPPDQRAYAYDDRPLPIGYGQTISQPFIVALMTDLLQIGPRRRRAGGRHRLRLPGGRAGGAGAGGPHDRDHPGARRARGRSSSTRRAYGNVRAHLGDGYYGIEQAAPFDAIIVTAAASHVPPPLIAQLEPGGRMVIPVGRAFALQHLMLIEKDEAGGVRSRQTLPVAFVPLTRGR